MSVSIGPSGVQSTEDYSVDDWGADFVGGIVLTPKTGGPGSTWGRTQEALEECDEDTDDSCAAAFDRSVRRGEARVELWWYCVASCQAFSPIFAFLEGCSSACQGRM